jgi:hypothetical protein
MKENLEKVQSPAGDLWNDKEFPASPHETLEDRSRTPMHTPNETYSNGTVIPISPTDDLLKVYATISPGYTRLATANNRNGSIAKYDVAVWIKLRDGSVPGLFVVSRILNGCQYAQIDLTLRKWKIISFQFFWMLSDRVPKRGAINTVDDPNTQYYAQIGSVWNSRGGVMAQGSEREDDSTDSFEIARDE